MDTKIVFCVEIYIVVIFPVNVNFSMLASMAFFDKLSAEKRSGDFGMLNSGKL